MVVTPRLVAVVTVASGTLGPSTTMRKATCALLFARLLPACRLSELLPVPTVSRAPDAGRLDETPTKVVFSSMVVPDAKLYEEPGLCA